MINNFKSNLLYNGDKNVLLILYQRVFIVLEFILSFHKSELSKYIIISVVYMCICTHINECYYFFGRDLFKPIWPLSCYG